MATTTYGTPYVSGTDLVANWPAASLTVANSIDSAGYYIGRGINAQVISYTAVLTDAGKTITQTNVGATTITIPANASVAFVVGSRINILNLGAGACTPTAGAGVTIAGTITALATNGSASLVKTATNTWSYIATSGGTGTVSQIVTASFSTQTSSASSTYADTGLTATITPTSTTSRIVAQGFLSNQANNSAECAFKLIGGASTLLTFTGVGHTVGTMVRSNIPFLYVDTPGSTAAKTYKIQFASTNSISAVYVAPASLICVIYLMELM